MTADDCKKDSNTRPRRYSGKPEPELPSLKIVRDCLGCGREFVASSRYIRLCGCRGIMDR